jgi:hypothetical protein
MRAWATSITEKPIFSSCFTGPFLACEWEPLPAVKDRSNLVMPSGLMINFDYFAETPKEESTVRIILADF